MAATLTQEGAHGDDVALATSAVLLYTAGNRASASEPEIVRVQRLDASILNTVGGSDVASGSNGVVLDVQYDFVDVRLRAPGATIYGIAASGTPSVTVTRIG
jgi:hypothetical protein